jgi:hypothetical protein
LCLGAEDDIINNYQNRPLLLQVFLLFEKFGDKRSVPLRKEKPWIPITLQQGLENGITIRASHKTQY